MLTGGGDDTIQANSGADTLSGGAGADLNGNREIDLIVGGAGDDILYGGQNNGPATVRNGKSAQRGGIETVSGGDGADIVYGFCWRRQPLRRTG